MNVWNAKCLTLTHTYDGIIDTGILLQLHTIKLLTLDQKKHRGQELIDSININVHAMKILETLILDMGTSMNIDITNGLVADDLISLCWNYRNNIDFIAELEIQLNDMRDGFCAQGRTHRLFQLLVAFQN